MKMCAVLPALAVALGGCVADTVPQRTTSGVVDEVARRAVEEGKVTGLAIVVARGGAVVFERGYGRASFQTGEPMTSEAVLDYFSIGKHVTAAILLRLAERGELASRYPDVRVARDNQAVIDNCDIIMLAVRGQVAHEVLSGLRFQRGHHVVSLIATLSREEYRL